MATSDDSPPSGTDDSDHSSPVSEGDSSDGDASSSDDSNGGHKKPSSLGLDFSSAADDGFSVPKPSEAASDSPSEPASDSEDDEGPEDGSQTMRGGYQAPDVGRSGDESTDPETDPTASAVEGLEEGEEVDGDAVREAGTDPDFDIPAPDDPTPPPDAEVTDEGVLDDDVDEPFADAETAPSSNRRADGSASADEQAAADSRWHDEASLDEEGEDLEGDFGGYDNTRVNDLSEDSETDSSSRDAGSTELFGKDFASSPTPTDLDGTDHSAERAPPTPEQAGSTPPRSPGAEEDRSSPSSGGRRGRPDSLPDDSSDSSTSARTPNDADAPPEGEFEEEETELFDSPFERDPICPRLVVLDGPSAGQEYLLNSMRNSIGRATNNTVVVSDEAMSRQHMEIVQNPDDTYSLKDLQSVNGTYLNGTQVREADLFHGDRIEIGQTTFQFVIPGESAPAHGDDRRLVPAEERRPEGPEPTREHPNETTSHRAPGAGGSDDQLATWLNWIIVGAVALCIPLAGATIWLVVSKGGGGGAGGDQARTAKQAYLAGVDAIGNRDWEKAHRKFTKTKRLDPDFEGVDSQLERLRLERKAKSSLASARSKLDEGDVDRALELAESVPRESVYYKDARELIREQRRQRKIEKLYEKAKKQDRNDEHQKALATIQRILDLAPNHDEALDLRHEIETEDESDLESDAGGEESPSTRKGARHARDRHRRRRTGTGSARQRGSGGADSDEDDSWLIEDMGGPEEGDDESSSDSDEDDSGSGGGTRVVNFTEGFTLYKRENFDAAIEHFERAASRSDGAVAQRAQSAADNIGRVESAFEAGAQALESQNWATAADQFRKALRADRDVAESGFLKPTIDRKLAHTTAGEGMQRFADGNYADAFEKYEQAKAYDANHPKVNQLLGKLEEKATSLYIQAANKRKTDPSESASICRKIMSMVPPDDESYEKAEKLLADL